MLVATKLGRVVTYHEGLPSIKSRGMLQDQVTKKHYNSTTRVVMSTKLCSVVNCLDEFLPIKSHDPLIT